MDGRVFAFPVGHSVGFFRSLLGLAVKMADIVGFVPTKNYIGYDDRIRDGGDGQNGGHRAGEAGAQEHDGPPWGQS